MVANVVKGASAIREATEQKGFSDFGWFKLDDGQSTRVVFLQEIDYDAPGYSEDMGVGVLATYFSPDIENGFLHRYTVSEETEELLEQIPEWDVSTRLFINVLAERDGEWKHEIWNASKTVARTLVEWSDEYEGLTGKVWKVRRTGKGRSTQYMFMVQPNTEVPKFEGDIVDPEKVLLKPLTAEAVAEHAGGAKPSNDSEDTDDSLKW